VHDTTHSYVTWQSISSKRLRNLFLFCEKVGPGCWKKTNSNVTCAWHDASICDMTRLHVCVFWMLKGGKHIYYVWHDSFICDSTDSYVTQFIHMWQNRLCRWREDSTPVRLTGARKSFGLMHSDMEWLKCTRLDTFIRTWLTHMWHDSSTLIHGWVWMSRVTYEWVMSLWMCHVAYTHCVHPKGKEEKETFFFSHAHYQPRKNLARWVRRKWWRHYRWVW